MLESAFPYKKIRPATFSWRAEVENLKGFPTATFMELLLHFQQLHRFMDFR
jgi:hypothetical protein